MPTDTWVRRTRIIVAALLGLLSFAIGFKMLSGEAFSYWGEWRIAIIWIIFPVCFYLMAIPAGIVLARVSRMILRLHRMIRLEVFQKAINPLDWSIFPIVSACLIVNFTMYTLAYMLPMNLFLSMIFPALDPLQSLVPSQYIELLSPKYPLFVQFLGLSGFLLIFIVMPLISGPALLFAVRWARERGHLRGGRLFEVMQLLWYSSIVILGYSLYKGSPPSGTDFPTYFSVLLSWSVPGTIWGSVLIVAAGPEDRKELFKWVTK
jgi:hypothetical protein